MATKTLPQLLKEAQARRGVNKSAAARMLGVTRTTMRSWERGAQEPGLRHAPRIIEFTQEDPRVVFEALGLDTREIEILFSHAKGVSLTSLSRLFEVFAEAS